MNVATSFANLAISIPQTQERTGLKIEREGLAVVVRRGASIVGVFCTLKAAFAFIASGAGR